MTATVDSPEAAGGPAQAGDGRVVRITGPVVDIEFSAETMPPIYNALHVDITIEDQTTVLTLEVEQHLGDDTVRAIAMAPTDGLTRGAVVTDTPARRARRGDRSGTG